MTPSSSPPQKDEHHLVLIHGAWAGAWVWQAVTPLLEQAGYTLHAVNLPGNQGEIPPETVTLDLYCDYIQSNILNPIGDKSSSDKPKVTLVAHSGAGVIALQLAEHLGKLGPKLHSMVIVAGMLLPSGVTFAQFRALQPDLPADPLDLVFTADGSSSTVTRASALQCFFQDFPPDVAQTAADKLTVQPTGGLNICANYTQNGGARQTPILYIQALQDASVILPLQRAMHGAFVQDNPHANLVTVVSMDTGHVPQVVQPERFCQIVDDYLQQQQHQQQQVGAS